MIFPTNEEKVDHLEEELHRAADEIDKLNAEIDRLERENADLKSRLGTAEHNLVDAGRWA